MKNIKVLNIVIQFSLTLICSLFYSYLKAADGCYVGGVLYTSHTSKSGNYFYRSPGDISADCGYTGTLSGRCYLYNSGNESKNNSYTRFNGSYSSSIAVIPCPIDDQIWLSILALTLGGALKFRLIKA